MTFTLLLTCVGGELSPQVIRSVKTSHRHDVKVIGVDTRPDAAGRHFVDHFATVPPGNDLNYVDTIAGLVAQYQVDMVLPTSDEEAVALSSARERIETGRCHLACAAADVVKTVSSKVETYIRLAALGIAVPAWQCAQSLEEIETVVEQTIAFWGEAVVKPTGSRGGRGVCVIRSDVRGARPYEGGREVHMDQATFRRDYLKGFAGQLPVVVMQRLVEPVYDIDMLAWEGRPVRVVPRRRTNSALPNEGHTIVENPDLVQLGTELIKALDLTWLYDCDIMYDRDGRPGILEVNPRPSGSIAVTIAAGVPLIDDLISLAKGEPVPEVELPVGRVVIPFKSVACIRSGAR